METTTDTKRQDTEVLASDILLAILVNLKILSSRRQLFLKGNYNTFQEIFISMLSFLSFSAEKFFRKYFIFSDSGPVSFSPSLQQAIKELQLAGMICWPDLQEPDLMRLNQSAEDWYREVLTADEKRGRLSAQDIVTIQQIARKIMMAWPELVVDRPHLMNC